MESLLWAGWELMRHRLLLPPDAGLQVTPQAVIDKYRADFLFLILDEAKKTKRLVVEVDGHDFHERTKAQAAKDRSRDRWMAENGYDVMRFTGSEVYANPCKCALEIAGRLYVLRHGRTQREAYARAGLEAIMAMIQEGS